jgi:hypothetical protein
MLYSKEEYALGLILNFCDRHESFWLGQEQLQLQTPKQLQKAETRLVGGLHPTHRKVRDGWGTLLFWRGKENRQLLGFRRCL